MKRIVSVLILITLLTSALCAFSSCGSNPAEGLGSIVYVEIDMADGSYMKLELYPNVAPITVANFVDLCNAHFYDGIYFHRVINNFMIQAGDPTGTGMGGSETTIKGEFQKNGVQNAIKHERGVISMARRSNDNDSASSQFFIVHQTSMQNSMSLDGSYAAFGRVIEGIETVDKIASVATDGNDKPLANQTMKTIRVITEEQAKAEGPAPMEAAPAN